MNMKKTLLFLPFILLSSCGPNYLYKDYTSIETNVSTFTDHKTYLFIGKYNALNKYFQSTPTYVLLAESSNINESFDLDLTARFFNSEGTYILSEKLEYSGLFIYEVTTDYWLNEKDLIVLKKTTTSGFKKDLEEEYPETYYEQNNGYINFKSTYWNKGAGWVYCAVDSEPISVSMETTKTYIDISNNFLINYR